MELRRYSIEYSRMLLMIAIGKEPAGLLGEAHLGGLSGDLSVDRAHK